MNVPRKSPDLCGKTCVVVALVSAKDKTALERIAGIEAELCRGGARIVGRMVQRRGVSKGGVAKLNRPLSPATVISAGKVQELASLVRESGADLIVFLNELTSGQAERIEEITSCRVWGYEGGV
jgi:hypothetical protein